MIRQSNDNETASAFASSWNNLPQGSIYTREQFEDWMSPLQREQIFQKSVLELGCGNGSLLIHMLHWEPSTLTGVDLGDSVTSAKRNLNATGKPGWQILQRDLTSYEGPPCDLVYFIGVLHHLKNPKSGFDSLIRNTRPGGCFHCWVYAREGNWPVRFFVEPIRKLSCRLPWWLTKYGIATPLSLPVFLAAKCSQRLSEETASRLPLGSYLKWLGRREWSFSRHVVFDQLVTPHTTYLDQSTIRSWLASPSVKPHSSYLIFRNGNSWKFGGIVTHP